MKIKTLTLNRYSYERFLELAQNFVIKEISHENQGWFFIKVINGISEEAFLDWIKHDLTLALVIDGKARRKIPLKQRYAYAEEENCAFILYRP